MGQKNAGTGLPVVDMEPLSIPLERDLFMRTLIRHLSGSLAEIVGLEQSEGFISVVGQAMGSSIHDLYLSALDQPKLEPGQISAVLVDLKRRIAGDFHVIEESEERIVLGNRRCPFGDLVEGRPSLCMMTSNVFGSIAASTTGYARVELQETIAQGHAGCRVVVHLRPTAEADRSDGQEYFGD